MIEIIATSSNEAQIIERCGANQIELISAFSEGGLTPSYEVIEATLKNTNLPVNIMIRPHSKSFVYTDEEIEAMKATILNVKILGANGVVFGVLNKQKEICENRLTQLLSVCDGLEVTFHRAIDDLLDIQKGIKTLSKYPQITNVLTSSGRGNIIDNISMIKIMMKEAKHIKIMVGGGLNFNNIDEIVSETKSFNYHFGTAIRYQNSHFETIDESKLQELITLVNKLIKET